jgi:hypothetical protein
MTRGAPYDPETITLLKRVLAEAESALPQQRRSSEAKVKLATGILKAAAEGERDPYRLRAAGLVAIE